MNFIREMIELVAAFLIISGVTAWMIEKVFKRAGFAKKVLKWELSKLKTILRWSLKSIFWFLGEASALVATGARWAYKKV